MRKMRVLVMLAGMSLPVHGQGLEVTACVTADNFYALYCGQADGSGLRCVGRNERVDISSDPRGCCSWCYAETWPFRVGTGEHFYVVAWNDENPGGIAMWIGAFNWSGGSLRSNAADWECAMSSRPNPNTVGEELTRSELPTLDDLEDEIHHAQWSAPGAVLPNGADEAVWGTIELVNDAEFIWFDSFYDSMCHDRFFIYRSRDTIGEVLPGETQLTRIRLSPGYLHFTLVSASRCYFRLEASPDLRAWRECRLLFNERGALEVSEPVHHGCSFYRVVRVD